MSALNAEPRGGHPRAAYAYNVSVNSRGVEIVAPNCLACHASHLRGQLVVPTLEAVLDASKRPRHWSSRFAEDDYDLERVGWKSGTEGRGYDTGELGRSMQGHTFGDALDAAGKRAVLEYLETL